MLQVTSPSLASEVMGMPPITTPTYAKEFKKVIEAAARGRQIFTVQVNFYIHFSWINKIFFLVKHIYIGSFLSNFVNFFYLVLFLYIKKNMMTELYFKYFPLM